MAGGIIKAGPQNAIPCPGCGSNRISHKWTTSRIPGGKSVLWCADCGFGWQHPLPTSQEIHDYYDRFPPYILHGTNEKEIGFSHRVDRISELMPHRGRLLDIGSGLGHFLELASKDGWEVFGVEPQKSAADYCREQLGVEVHTDLDENLDLAAESFQVVTLWDVWEHVHEPLLFLKRCVDLVAPGGLLVISIPNASGWPARIFRGRWRYVMFTHLNYFTMSYVDCVLRARGFLIERADHTLKAQSIMQGLTSCLPIQLDTERIIRLGRKDSIERGRPEQARSHELVEKSPLISKFLGRIRRLVLEMNLVTLPGSIGDLMDLYCRKEE